MPEATSYYEGYPAAADPPPEPTVQPGATPATPLRPLIPPYTVPLLAAKNRNPKSGTPTPGGIDELSVHHSIFSADQLTDHD